MDLTSEWIRCRDWLLPALERGRYFFSEADIIDGLVVGDYHFYPSEKSAVVYSITDYPVGKALVFLLAGGDLEDLRQAEKVLIKKAQNLNCDRVEYCGRRGWLRALGYTETFCVGIKEI